MLKSYQCVARVVGVGLLGGPQDFSVSPSPFGLVLGTGLDNKTLKHGIESNFQVSLFSPQFICVLYTSVNLKERQFQEYFEATRRKEKTILLKEN